MKKIKRISLEDKEEMGNMFMYISEDVARSKTYTLLEKYLGKASMTMLATEIDDDIGDMFHGVEYVDQSKLKQLLTQPNNSK